MLVLLWAAACRPAPVIPLGLPPYDDGTALVAPPRVRWERQVGLTHYRMQLLVEGGEVWVPSNGRAWDGQADDDLDGIWVLDARTGAVRRHLVPPGDGERDVNGVALDGDHLFYATDQPALVRARLDGTVDWRIELAGDVEGPPVLAEATGDGGLDVGVAVEGVGFELRDGATGALVRQLAGTAWAQPATADLDGDGRADWLIVERRSERVTALDADGRVTWSLVGPGTYFAPPSLATIEAGSPPVAVLASRSALLLADPRTGSPSLFWRPPDPETAFYSVGVFREAGCVLLGTAPTAPGPYCVTPDGVERFTLPLLPTRISGGAVFGDVDGRPGDEAVLATESGEVLALDVRGRQVWLWTAPDAIETPPTLADVDHDGRTDVVVASRDGFVRVLQTLGRAPASPRYWRGDAHNTGVMP
ncbi:MAG: hypothetical protein ABMB14_22515 [Myxococcota bacterium]